MIIVKSVNGIPIRLTDERIEHIEQHLYLNVHKITDVIQYPDFVVRGKKGSLRAVLNIGGNRWLNVIYREFAKLNDGFIITAYEADNVDLSSILWER